MIDTKLKNRVVLITGANNPYGIGAATARAFTEQGASVFATYLRQPSLYGKSRSPGEAFYSRQNAKTADGVVRAIRRTGAKIETCEIDIAVPANIPILFDNAERVFGQVDILVNNAAYCRADTFAPPRSNGSVGNAVDGLPMTGFTADTHDVHFAVNSRAVALLIAEYARRSIARKAGWGRIINVSTDGASGFRTEVSYGASKHAMESYSCAAAKELGWYGITSNVVSLGPIQTGWISAKMEREIKSRIPLGRVGKPADVADVIVFLASQQARWVTGQLIYVGGGHAMPQ